MSAYFLGLCFDHYYIAVLCDYVSKMLSGTSTCLSVITVHFCVFTFFFILKEMRQAASAFILLEIFIESVPKLWVPREKLHYREV